MQVKCFYYYHTNGTLYVIVCYYDLISLLPDTEHIAGL